MDPDTTHMPDQGPCRICDTPHRLANDPTGQQLRPGEGDISVCLECGALALWSHIGTARQPTADEYDEILQEAAVRKSLCHIWHREVQRLRSDDPDDRVT